MGSAKSKNIYDRHHIEGDVNHGRRLETITTSAFICWLKSINIPAAIQDASEIDIGVTWNVCNFNPCYIVSFEPSYPTCK